MAHKKEKATRRTEVASLDLATISTDITLRILECDHQANRLKVISHGYQKRSEELKAQAEEHMLKSNEFATEASNLREQLREMKGGSSRSHDRRSKAETGQDRDPGQLVA